MHVMKVARMLNENYYDNMVYARSRGGGGGGGDCKLYVFIVQLPLI